ncbi:HNH endonuclease [Paramicrobacterium humi]|uniref:HNH endonuclease n=1 Tax=Paramicrobacterium humi TaxID=640635 RepID=A0A1H4J9Z1_9MICO|nr:HNH endonuclease signature motif containing protein [Microbacterium humi]SEB42806.1 HNH endonuclease [Microbacterium humi]
MNEQARWSDGIPHVADAAAMRAAETALSAVAELIDIDPGDLTANGLLEYTGLLGNIARVVEGRQVGNVGEIARRSGADAGLDGLAARHGAATPAALFEKITGAKNSTAYRYARTAKHATPRVSDAGAPLPPLFEHTAAVLAEGIIGLDAAEALTATLAAVLPRAIPAELDEAERTLLGNATGASGNAPLPADELRLQAKAFCIALDPDGAEPTAEQQHQARSLTFTAQDDGMLRIAGRLSPEQAAIVTPVFDAFMSPRTGPVFLTEEELAAKNAQPEQRSRSQERSDVFTAIIGGVGKQDATPKLHGRGPTVLVVTNGNDLQNGTGAACSPGTPEPLPQSFVRQMQCDGDTRPLDFRRGEVLNLGAAERFFAAAQRLALIARDGPTCVADGCTIPAWLTEAHHIVAWADGGRTDLRNGVMVCWFHHRLLERGEWSVRIVDGRARMIPPAWYVGRRYLRRQRRELDSG